MYIYMCFVYVFINIYIYMYVYAFRYISNILFNDIKSCIYIDIYLCIYVVIPLPETNMSTLKKGGSNLIRGKCHDSSPSIHQLFNLKGALGK